MLNKKLLIFFVSLLFINNFFALEKKVFSRAEFIENEFGTFIQENIYGNFSPERKEYSVVDEDNGYWLSWHYFKTGDYYYCMAKSLCPINDDAENAILYINNENKVGTICDIWTDDIWKVKRITFGWNDDSDLIIPLNDYADITINVNGNIKKYKIPINIKELQFKQKLSDKTNDIVIDVPYCFRDLNKINFLYGNSKDKIIVNCNERIEINKS